MIRWIYMCARTTLIPVLFLIPSHFVTPVPAAGKELSGAATPAAFPPLTSPPLGERWFSLVMNDERTGFGFVRTRPHPDGYEIFTEGSVKMLVLGFSREAASREHFLVNKDLSLRSFDVEQILDGSPMRVSGEKTAKGFRIVVESKGGRNEKVLKASGAVYPPAVVNLYPLMKGINPGKKYKLNILDVEAVKIKKVAVTAVGIESLSGGIPAVHLQNDLYSFVSNDVWVDRDGNTLRESVRDGLIETRAEQEQAARQFLVNAALAKKDLILGFSLVRVDEAIERVRDLEVMKLEVSDFPKDVPLLEGAGQQARRSADGKVLFTITKQVPVATASESEPPAEYLAASDRILTGNQEIRSLKDSIVAAERDPVTVVRKFTTWVAENIRESVLDSQSPLETLSNRTGDCQSHARLYVSLARTAGIPSKFVSGLVYVPEKGFLYHSWAESFVGTWIAVDPTFDEVPADATHVKLVEGDTPQEMVPIICLIGRIKARVVEKSYDLR